MVLSRIQVLCNGTNQLQLPLWILKGKDIEHLSAFTMNANKWDWPIITVVCRIHSWVFTVFFYHVRVPVKRPVFVSVTWTSTGIMTGKLHHSWIKSIMSSVVVWTDGLYSQEAWLHSIKKMILLCCITFAFVRSVLTFLQGLWIKMSLLRA